jgi:hypothetical protein
MLLYLYINILVLLQFTLFKSLLYIFHVRFLELYM